MGLGERSSRIRAAMAVLSVGAAIWLGRPLLAQKPAQTPSAFYLSFVAAAEKMTSLKDVLPFFPADQVAVLSTVPKESEKQMIEKAKQKLVTGVRILKESPYQDGFLLEMEGTQKSTPTRVRGWAKIIREGGAWKLAKDDWTGGPPPAAPKIPATVLESGRAVGEFTVNGKAAKLLYARATAGPDSFDKTKTEYHVTLSDAPWKPNDSSQSDKVKAGTLHWLELSIGETKQVYGTMLYHEGFENGFLSSAGSGPRFEAEKLGPDVVAGRVYLEAPRTAGSQTFYYAATFRAPVEKNR